MVQQQFPRSQPSRIKIGEIAARDLLRLGFSNLARPQDSDYVKPHACRGDRCQQQPPYGLQSFAQDYCAVLGRLKPLKNRLMLQLVGPNLLMPKRIVVSVVIGVATGIFCWFLLHRLHQDAADFRWALHLARRILDRQNPYDTPLEQYPLTAAFFAFPFLRLPPEIAAALFYGISTALLMFGLTRNSFRGLLVLFAYPYWAGLITAQWSTLIAAGAFFPILLPATLAKPQVGLPVFLTRLTRRGLVACLVLAVLSLLLLPRWPILWLHQASYYQHFFPMFVLPGPLLLLALVRYRDRDGWLLLLTALMPQRWFFDSFILWLIPKSRREVLFSACVSWGAGIWRWYHQPLNFTEVGRAAVIFIYLPMLAVVLLRKAGSTPDAAPELAA